MYDISGKMSRMIIEGYGIYLGAKTMHLPESSFTDMLLLGREKVEKSLASSLTN
jgi:hypothetical protein